MTKIVITGDVHLTGRPDHEYRWKAVSMLQKYLERDDVEAAFILGDWVDSKDKHPSKFVNRLVDATAQLGTAAPVFFLKGNHDYVDPKCPFFGFMDHLEGITYIIEPTAVPLMSFVHASWDLGPETATDDAILMLPHGSSWAKCRSAAWHKELPLKGLERPWHLIFTHETFGGSMASSGEKLEGVPLSGVNAEATNGTPIISGDIHVPQTLGNVTYVGSPHPVHFGDSFQPRIILWDMATREMQSIDIMGIRRTALTVELQGNDLIYSPDIEEQDHVKARFMGTNEHLADWAEIRQSIRDLITSLGAHCFGVEFVNSDDGKVEHQPIIREETRSDEQFFDDYCKSRKISEELRKVGKRFL